MRMKRRDYLKLAAGLPAIATSNAMAMSAEISAGKPKETVNFSADVPVKYNVDVFVAGGGPAGIAAMVAAAESGADVYAAEALSCFGGMGTSALVPLFMQMTDGINFLAAGFGSRVRDALYSQKSFKGSAHDIETLKRVYDELAEKSGAKFTFCTKVIGVKAAEGKIDCAICSGLGGIFAVKAKVFIDATGNGDLAFMAGAKYEKGDKNGKMMPGSLCSTWCSIDWQKWRKNKPDMPQPQSFKVKEAYEAGVFSFYDPHMTGIFEIGDGLGGGNIGHAFGVDGTDEGSVTRALLHCRKSMREYKNYYNKYVPGFENAKVVSTGSAMGIRETRRFVGDYTLNIDDYMKRAVFDDEIGRYAYPIDIHPSSFDKGELERHRQEFDKLYKYAKGESYGIPYRILTPKGFDNLYTAGRCASSDELVHGSIRVMPACFIMGQAAGIGASMAAGSNVSVHDIDVKTLQGKLVKFGAYLPNFKA